MTRFTCWSLGIGVAFIVLIGLLVDRSQMVRKLNKELNQERKERQRASDMAVSATKAYHDADAMIEQYRAERQKQYEARAQIARMLPVTPEHKIANLQAQLQQSRSQFLSLGKLGANFRVFEFHRETTIPTLLVEGGRVTDEIATELSYSGIPFIRMSEVDMAADARAILMEQYGYSHGDPYVFELRGTPKPPLAK